MAPLHHHVYVAEELRRLRERPATPREQARLRWLAEQAARRRTRRHMLALWLGERLIALGDRLQAWANAHAQSDTQICTGQDTGS